MLICSLLPGNLLAADKQLQPSDLSYLGAFRVPQGAMGSSSGNGLAYGGGVIAYNPANNSLFIVGHDSEQLVGEISIPANPVNTATLSSMPTAAVLQNLSDITEGRRTYINGPTGTAQTANAVKIGGLLVNGNNLIGSVYSYYDGNKEATLSHFKSGTKLATTGDFQGMFAVSPSIVPGGGNTAGFVSGYMTSVPDNSGTGGTNWQSALGGAALTGNSDLSIISRTSYGASAFAFDPAQVGAGSSILASSLLFYDINHQSLGVWSDTQPHSDYVSIADNMSGVNFPPGTQTVIFTGLYGTGTNYYGEAANCPQGPDVYMIYKGTHSWPYIIRAYFYDAAYLARVKAGDTIKDADLPNLVGNPVVGQVLQPWNLKPYAMVNLSALMKTSQGLFTTFAGASAYDPNTKRLYVVQPGGDNSPTYGLPLIHVFQLNTGTSTATPDTTLPTVSITAPANSASVSGTVSVSATASDNVGVTKVEFYVNGALQVTDTSTPYLYSWDTSTLAAGSYTLTTKAYDAAGNVGQSGSVTVTVVKDTTPPSVALTSPVNNATVSGPVTISASASDNIGVNRVELYENSVLLTASNVTPVNFNWNTASVPNGSYALTAKAYDATGNVAQTGNVTVTVNNPAADTTAPSVTAFTVPATATSLIVPITTFTATDNTAVTGYQVTESATPPAASSVAWTGSAPASYTLTSAGSKTLYAWAKDAAGNVSASRSATITVSTTVATADPLANAKTQATLAYLQNLPNLATNRVVSGQFAYTISDVNNINSQTGHYPGMIGTDVANSPISVSNLTAWSNANGLVTALHHWNNPNGGNSWTTMSDADFLSLATPGTALNTKFNAYLDSVVSIFQSYATNGITVLYRPFHEMNGGWFWWGAKNTTNFKTVWKYVFNYMTTTKGLHNILWVYGPNSGSGITDYYPGSQYVDITGMDLYGGVDVTDTADYNALVALNKPFGLTEYGPGPASGMTPTDWSHFIVSLESNMPKAAFWMNWGNTFAMAVNPGTATVLADSRVITRDEMPVLGGSDTTTPTVTISSPANSATVSGTVSVAASASDNVGVTKVEIYINGTLKATDTATPYTYSWDTTGTANGSYTLTAKAYDASGNIGQTGTITVTVNNLSPVADTSAPTTPANPSATAASASQINLTWTASTDNVGVAGYKISRNGTQIGTATANSYQDTGLAASTSYTYTVAAFDAAGNTSAQSASVSATTPQSPAGVTSAGTACNASTLPITGTRIINVSTEPQLQSAMSSLQAGDTIVLANGTYNLSNSLYINGKDNVTIRGGTGCDGVVLVGQGMDNASYGNVPYGVWSNAANTTIAHLTIRDTYDNEIVFNSGAQAPHVYSVKLLNAGSQFIKSNPTDIVNGIGVNNGAIEYSWMEYTNGTPNHSGSVGYTNGISAHAVDGWAIRGNLFKNFHTPDTAAYLWNPAVLMWDHSRNTITENNVFINVDRAVAYGLQDATGSDHTGGVIRNNFVYLAPSLMSATRKASSDAAIIVWDSPASAVYHNTVLTNGNVNNSIEFRFATTGAEARNNLADAPINTRDSATYTQSGNYLTATASMFADPASGNLHLLDNTATRANVIDKVAVLPSVTTDIDGDNRPSGANADIGADEFVSASDTIAPIALISAPASNATVSGTVSVTSTASDNVGVTKVEFYVNGVLKATDSASPYTFTWDTTTLANGSATLTTMAYDAAGNIGQSAAVSVTVNNTSVTITVPKTYYVSPLGNDAATCSQATPCRQISKALTLVKAGDTVLVADGTYQGLDITGINGTSQSPITIKAQGSNAYLGNRASGIGNLFLENCSYIIFDGIMM